MIPKLFVGMLFCRLAYDYAALSSEYRKEHPPRGSVGLLCGVEGA
jgi:hypothetical protein